MNTSFVYTFRTKNAVLNHLRALAQFSTSISHSNLPLSTFRLNYPYLSTALTFLRNNPTESLYVGYHTHGFEFFNSLFSLTARLSYYTDIIAVYNITFVNGYYELREHSINK